MCILVSCAVVLSGEIHMSGVIRHSETNEGIPSVSVQLDSRGIEVYTDDDGYFEIYDDGLSVGKHDNPDVKRPRIRNSVLYLNEGVQSFEIYDSKGREYYSSREYIKARTAVALTDIISSPGIYFISIRDEVSRYNLSYRYTRSSQSEALSPETLQSDHGEAFLDSLHIAKDGFFDTTYIVENNIIDDIEIDLAVYGYSVLYHAGQSTGGEVPEDTVLYPPGSEIEVAGNFGDLVRDSFVFVGWNTSQDNNGENIHPNTTIEMDTRDIHLYPRWVQTEQGEDQRIATEITGLAHKAVMNMLRPDLYEYHADAAIDSVYQSFNVTNPAFGTITASGPNALNLHHSGSSRRMRQGDLLLVDIGARHNNWCSDISRTYPVNGTFTERQRELYQLVLDAKKHTLSRIIPNVTTLRQLSTITNDFYKSSSMRAEDKYGRLRTMDVFFIHSVSHYVGTNVHGQDLDISPYAPIAVGSIFVLEPGLYIESEETGIRIEDMYIMTPDGAVNLFPHIPQEIDEIEEILAESDYYEPDAHIREKPPVENTHMKYLPEH
jgi:hypothetical protein